jgi:hypothetical protein
VIIALVLSNVLSEFKQLYLKVVDMKIIQLPGNIMYTTKYIQFSFIEINSMAISNIRDFSLIL